MSELFLENITKTIEKLDKLETPDLEKFVEVKTYLFFTAEKLAPSLDVDHIYESAFEDLKKLVKIDVKHNDKLVRYIMKEAEELTSKNKFGEAIIKYQEALDILRKHKRHITEYEETFTNALSRYSNLLFILFRLTDIDEESQDILRKLNPKYVEDNNNILQDIVTNFEKIIDVLDSSSVENKNVLISYSYKQIAEATLQLGSILDAIEIYKKQLELLSEMTKKFDITKQQDPNIEIGITKTKLSECFVAINARSAAMSELEEAVDMLEQMHNKYGRLEKELGYALLFLISLRFEFGLTKEEDKQLAVKGWDLYGPCLEEYEIIPSGAFMAIFVLFEGLEEQGRREETLKIGDKAITSVEMHEKMMPDELKNLIHFRSTGLHINIAILYDKLKRPQEGYDLLRNHYNYMLEEVKIKDKLDDPMYAQSYIGLLTQITGLAISSKDYSTAEEYANLIIKLQPNDAQVLNMYAWCILHVGKLEEAEEAARKALMFVEHGAIWDTLATILWKQKRYEEADEAFKEAVKLEDKDSEIWRNYGDFLKEQGKEKAAKEAFEKAEKIENPR
jgi:tetratricopeptide (TPR) repeat protein